MLPIYLLKLTLKRDAIGTLAELLDSVRTEFPERIDCWEWTIQALSQLHDTSGLKSLHNETKMITIKKDREWVQTRLITELACLEGQHRDEHKTINEFLEKRPKKWASALRSSICPRTSRTFEFCYRKLRTSSVEQTKLPSYSS